MSSSMQTELNQVLADYQIHYQKLRNYHWNVKGPHFLTLHDKFEELYTGVADKIDEIAERILSSGGTPLSSFKDYLNVAELQEDDTNTEAMQMVANLVGDMDIINKKLRAYVEKAHKADDVATANLLEDYADEQEKTVWMLNAFLGK